MIDVGKVAMLPISSIIVAEDRTREEMGDLESMRSNMRENGFITPISVKDLHDGTYLLLAGERRFTIISSEEGNTEIPARIYDRDLNELEMAIIEESENLYRKDMTWIEKDRLTSKIHILNQQLYGIKGPGPSSEGWSTRDTAEAVGAKSNAEVVNALKRASLYEDHPELFEGCKTASDASKIISKISEAAIKQQIASKIETQTLDIQLQKLNDAYIIRNFFDGIKEIPDNLFHLVDLDPPYAIDYTKYKQADGESKYQLDNYNEVPDDIYINGDPNGSWKGIKKVLKECYRTMAENSWLICWYSMQPWFETFHKELLNTGFKVSRHCGIWTKGSPGQNYKPNTRLSTGYDAFFYAAKGTPVLNKPGRSNDFNFPRIPPSQQTHPTERPIELQKELYETFAFPGSRILIPFLGSGNGLLASASLGMSALGFELSREYKDSFLVKAHNLSKKG